MPTTPPNAKTPGLLDTLRSLQFGLVVLIAIAIVAIIGTLIPQGQPPEFYEEHFSPLISLPIQIFRLDAAYGSPLFLGLLGLFGLNLIFCTLHRFPVLLRNAFRPNPAPERSELEQYPVMVSSRSASFDALHGAFERSGFPLKRIGNSRLFGQKGRLGYFGPTLVHLSLLLFLAGGMASLVTGKRGDVVLHRGESTALAVLPSGAKIPLGFTVQLDSFQVAYYDNFPDRPKSFTSSVTVTRRDGSTFKKEIRVNHPLMLNGFTVYQSSFGGSDDTDPMRAVAASNDSAVVEIRLMGAPAKMPPIITLDMTRDGVYQVPGFGDSISVRLSELQRNFRMGGQEEGENPAVKLDVLVRGQERWSVYAFKNYPGLNMPVQKDIPFSFVMRDLRTGGAPATEAAPEYYTVLGAVRDRGIGLMAAGAACMMLGMFLSFYIRPRRLWVLEENGNIIVGGQVKGDSGPFREYVGSIVKETEKHGSREGKS